jgi:hypothetical protein
MKHQRHFESVDAARETAHRKTLIADLDRIVEIINVDIVAEEEQAGVSDRSRPEYPMLARALLARRDNHLDTIAALKQRLGLDASGPSPAPRPEEAFSSRETDPYTGSHFGAWAAIRSKTSASSAAIRNSRAAFKGRLMFGSSELLSKVISRMQCRHWV